MTPEKAKALKLAKQAQGMLAKVIAMIEAGDYCPDIIQQADSVSGFLTSAKRELLTGHLNGCVLHRMHEDKEQTIKELMKIYQLTAR